MMILTLTGSHFSLIMHKKTDSPKKTGVPSAQYEKHSGVFLAASCTSGAMTPPFGETDTGVCNCTLTKPLKLRRQFHSQGDWLVNISWASCFWPAAYVLVLPDHVKLPVV